MNNPPIKERIESFLPHLIKCKDTDNLIIKGHILTEHALNFYIEMLSVEKINISKTKFTYANKVEISKILGLFKKYPELLEELTLLNKLRNSLAHRLRYDENTLTSFLKGFEKRKSGYGYKSQTLEIGKEIEVQTLDNEILKIDGKHMMLMLQISSICANIYLGIKEKNKGSI